MPRKKQQAPPRDTFIEEALRRFKLAADAESKIRQDALDDLRFRIGEQWPADIQEQRRLDGRPCLTINRIPQFIRQVTNEQRSARPAITVNPVGSGADVETAEVEQGIIRHIEIASDAEIAYDTAFDQMATGGLGYWRVGTEYSDDESFDQEIRIREIRNRFSVYMDPLAQQPDRSDARWAFVVADISHDTYRELYPNSALSEMSDFRSIGDMAPGWANDKTVRVAEYYYVTSAPETIGEGARTRKREKRTVHWALINAVEVLEETEIPCRWIPIVPVIGDDLDVDGERYIAGLVRQAKDPQRMYNFWVTSATETVALAPKAPFVAAEGQLEGHENEWKQANRRTLAVLQYKPVDAGGHLVGPPQRQPYEPPIQAMVAMTAQSDNDIKATTGIYDAALGQRGPQESGRAILARQKQTDVATLNYSDNLARALRFTGRILLDMIPRVYDTARVQRIVMPDQTTELVGIVNSQTGATPEDLAEEQGISKIYDVGVGRYDVTVTVGPSYQSKRQESAAAMMELVHANPAVFPVIGDLLVKNMDWPGAEGIAKRLKALVPPQAIQADGDDPQAAAQQASAKLAQAMQQNELLVKELQKATAIIEQKQIEAQAKIETARLQSDTQIAVAEVNTKAQQLSERLDWLQRTWTEMHQAAHDAASAAAAPAPLSALGGPGAPPAAAQSGPPPQANAPQQ